jgi:hypothetical protein
MVFARPQNVHFPIIPDNTFMGMTMGQKYRGREYDWDEVKELIASKRDKSTVPQIYFKGTNTGVYRHHLRENLEKEQEGKLLIRLDAWKHFEPLYKWSRYQAVLNLPGHYDWSNRFKYLFLLRNIVINVNVVFHGPESIEERWLSFIDYLVQPDRDYINLNIDQYDEDSPGGKEKNIAAVKDLTKRLNDLDLSNPKFRNMSHRAYQVVSKLTMSDVYYYLYKLLLELGKYTYV